MDWNELLTALRREGLLVSATAEGVDLAGLGIDTRTIGPGQLYCAVRGTTSDGHSFAAEAVGKGAAAVMGERTMGAGVPEILVTDGRRAASVAAPADRACARSCRTCPACGCGRSRARRESRASSAARCASLPRRA